MPRKPPTRPENKYKVGRPATASNEIAALAQSKNDEAFALVPQVAASVLEHREELDELCKLFFSHNDAAARIASLQSLIFAMSFKHNEGAVTHSWLASTLFCHEKWPFWPDDPDASIASRSTIDNFAYGRYGPSKPDTVLSYLLAVYLLHEVDHPCFNNYLASSLLIGNGAVDQFARIVSPDLLDPEERNDDRLLLAIVIRARALLKHLDIDPEDYSDEISSLLRTSFFFDQLTPCRTDGDLNQFKVGAVRIGPQYEYGDLVGSNVAFSLVVNYDPVSGQTEQFLYVSTSVSAERGGGRRTVSDGIVLVRNNEVIIFQHKLDGSGLNIATIPKQEVVHNSGVIKGVILTIDTIGGTGSLCSRICLFPKKVDTYMQLKLTDDGLYHALKNQPFYHEHMTRDILSSLRRVGRVEVSDPSGENNFISSWGAARGILESAATGKIDSQIIKGYQQGPLKAL